MKGQNATGSGKSDFTENKKAAETCRLAQPLLFRKNPRKENLICFFDSVTLVEPVDSSGSVYKLLLSGIERMAGRTDFNLNVLDS